MADREVKAKISLEDQLTPALEKIKDSLENFHGGVVSLASGLEILKFGGEMAMKAFEFLEAQMGKAFDEALEGEKATNRLKGAMVQAGIFTDELSESLEAHIDTLEEMVGANGEAVKGMVATGLQMGLNIQKAQELEQAARQLAAANNIDVNEAFSALQQSLAGNSRALGKLIPQVKDLGAAQLKQGEAINIVNEATKAQYEIYQTSLPAALDKSKVAFDNVYKALGETVTQSPALREAINQISGLFNNFTKFLNENKEQLIEWVNSGVLIAIDAVAGLAATLDAMHRGGVVIFNGLEIAAQAFASSLVGGIRDWLIIASKIPGVGDRFKETIANMSATVKDLDGDMQESMGKMDKALEGPTDAYKAVESTILGVREAVVQATAAEKDLTAAQTENLQVTSAKNAELQKLGQTYAGIEIGTRKSREALEAEVQTRDNSLKNFKNYLDSKTRLAVTQEEEEALEVQKIKAAALGDSEAGRLVQEQLAEQQFQMDVQKKYEQAALLGATDDELNAMAQAQYDQHLADMRAKKESFIMNDIKQNEQLGNQWGVTLAKIQLEQAKHGQVMGMLQGVFASQQVQGTKDMFGNLGQLRNSHSKTAFEVGKKAAIAQTTISTAEAAIKSYNAMAGIPFVGPVLGATAAAAAIAAGFVQIQNINAQEFSPGGKADSGMDSIPQSLSGRSFVMSGGERVVQPEANRDLTGFLDGQKRENGGAGKPTTVNITINGKLDQADADAAVDTMIEALRRASARGVQIIDERGIVKSRS